jgi:hypothetical protein
MCGEEEGDPLEKRAVIVAERGRRVRVDVDLPDHAALVGDWHHDLAPGRGEAGQVALVRVDVVDDFGHTARSCGPADALADWNADVLGRLRALPGAEHEIVALDEVDPHPGVMVEPVMEELDGLAEDLVRLALAIEDAVDRLQSAVIVAQERTASSRSAPSKPAITFL